jgi:DNA-binding SARP family transcriptional activator/tetratricopeptide (TPR) repeat protein
MYTLRLLGPPFLSGPSGPVSGRVAQERKLALLAVLALTDGRTLTRDSLAALFWPESDEARARHNVADGVWVIRSTLGEEAVLAQGNRLTLNPEVVVTDVEAFEEDLEKGDLVRAVELHAGPFMEGFHISGARGFEDWLSRERARLAAAHADALEELTRETLASGRAPAAAGWARRLSAADPLNTRRALLSMEALAASGDVAGAIRLGEVHAEELEEELGVSPPAEVEARIRELRISPPPVPVPRKGPAPRDPSSSAPSASILRQKPGPGEREGQATGAVPSDPVPLRTSLLSGRRRRTAATVAVAAVAFLVLFWLVPGMVNGDRPELVPNRIVVLSFENRTGDPELDLLGRLAAEVLIREIDRAGVGEVILPRDMIGTGVGTAGGPRGPGEARAVAQEALAGVSVSGTIDPGPDGPLLVTIITTGPDARVAAAPDPVPVDPGAPDQALERHSSRVVGTLAAHLGQELPEHPFVVRTPSYASYRTADRATGLFLDRRFREAAALFRSAYELDNTAVGYLLWSAISLRNVSDAAAVWNILEEIGPRRDELTPFDAAQFDWLEARVLGDLAAALRAARAAHAIHPHSGLGGFQLGLDLTRNGYLDEALEAYRRLDPDRGWLSRYQFYWGNLAGVLHLLGRHDEELSVAEEGYRRHPGSTLLNARVRALAALGRHDELARALREATTPGGSTLTAAWALHRHGHDSMAVAVAEDGLRALAGAPHAPDAFPAVRSARRNTEARLLLTAGRLEEARGVLLELLEASPRDRDLLGWTGFVEARLGLEAEARSRIRVLEELGREPFHTGGATVARAAIHAELGDDPRMVRLLLEQSHREGWGLHFFHFTPLFDPVRDHPEVRDFFEVRR